MNAWRGILVCLLAAAAWAQSPPTVSKVEPPNWWTKTTLSPVRVLIRGSNLQNARITSDLPCSRVMVNEKGSYLFADVGIPRHVRSGNHPLSITTKAGTVSAPFELLEPLAAEHRWAGFSPDDVIYLIMPDRFANGDPANDDPAVSPGLFDQSKPRFYHGGDLAGITRHLPYFKELGVTALWLNPWYDNVNHLNERETPGTAVTDYHGYGAVDFYGVEEHFGTLAELIGLVNAAHAAGIKIIQDEVANHTGPYHPWTTDSPTPTWFHGTTAHHPKETWQLWPLIDPHAPPALRAETLDGWFADILPDLNQDDPECARYLIQNTLWWIGITGLDAIRMDTLPYVPRAFWRDWIAAIRREYPRVNVVGEVFDADPAITSSFPLPGLTVFDFPSYFQVRNVIARGKGSIRELAGALAHDGLYAEPDVLGTFIGNHDVARFLNEEGATPDRLKLAFTWLLTTRGVPTIYYGEEIGMQGGNDPDNRRDFPLSAFSKDGRTAPQQDLFAHVQKLNQLRSGTPALRRGKTETLCVTEQQWVYARQLPEQIAVIELNNGDAPAAIVCPAQVANGKTVLGDGQYGDPIPAHSARVTVTK